MIKSTFYFLLLILPLFTFSQNNSYLGVESGPKFDVYESTDNGNSLYTEPFLFSPIVGVTLGREIHEVVSIETGFFVNDYGKSYRIKGEFIYFQSTAIRAIQMPLRLKSRFAIIEDRLDITAILGFTFAINTDYVSSGTGSSFSSSSSSQFNDSTRTEDVSRYNFKKTYGLIETGLSMDYRFKNSMILSFGANYLSGISRIIEMDVKYWVNDGSEQSGIVFSNGDYFSMTVGVKYPISKFWNKKSDNLTN